MNIERMVVVMKMIMNMTTISAPKRMFMLMTM